MNDPNLIDKLRARLAPLQADALDVALGVAGKTPLYLVGGSVRDLLLGLPHLDLDLVMEGEAAALARRIAAALGVRCLTHPAFGTATVKGRAFAFDIATARAEAYQQPGALPAVRPSTLADDLARRDFTINAMALALSGPARGQLVDPHAGQEDLSLGLVRVLHDGSFRDDATRILRALRYEARLGFQIEGHTLALLERDVGFISTISGARLRRELLRILEEAAPEWALLRGQALGVLAAIHPSLSFDEGRAAAFAAARLETKVEPLPLVYLALLAWRWSPQEAEAVVVRLALTKAQREAVVAMPPLRALAPRLAQPSLPASAVVDLLSPWPPASLWALALMASEEETRQRLNRYLQEWRYVKPFLDGDALLALGIPAGPALGELLRRLRAARLDGALKTRDDEVAFVRGALAARS